MMQTHSTLVNVSLSPTDASDTKSVDDLISRLNQQTIQLVRSQALIDQLQQQLSEQTSKANDFGQQLETMRQSKSWRVGHLAVRITNAFRRLLGLKSTI